jgi:hypothetical protein
MTPEEKPDKPELTKNDPETDPSLGVDWGSNIDPGPGPDPRVIKPRGDSDERRIAV